MDRLQRVAPPTRHRSGGLLLHISLLRGTTNDWIEVCKAWNALQGGFAIDGRRVELLIIERPGEVDAQTDLHLKATRATPAGTPRHARPWPRPKPSSSPRVSRSPMRTQSRSNTGLEQTVNLAVAAPTAIQNVERFAGKVVAAFSYSTGTLRVSRSSWRRRATPSMPSEISFQTT